mmetsp:Transcript_20532/g.57005  ORF Transcript_20532/g.57005 Transcript_20532/m.57005 type:complete len:158 (+) Transcript_20532:193-666(+)
MPVVDRCEKTDNITFIDRIRKERRRLGLKNPGPVDSSKPASGFPSQKVVLEYDPLKGSTLFPMDFVRPRYGTSSFEYGDFFYRPRASEPAGSSTPPGRRSVTSSASAAPPLAAGSMLPRSSSWSGSAPAHRGAQPQRGASQMGRIERLEAILFESGC